MPARARRPLALFAVLVAFVALAVVSGCRSRAAPAEAGPAGSPAAPTAAAASAPASPTYWSAVAPILEAHCTSCHAERGIGPMRLDSFEDAKANAAAIAFQTRERTMPPWLPDTHACADLRYSRALAEAEIETLDRWVKAGAPEGDRADHRPARAHGIASGALAKAPDRVAMPEGPYAPKQGRSDDYHCFVIDPKLEAAERVVGLRIAPGIPEAVHHVLLFEVRPRALATIDALDRREPGPGYTCFGGIGVQPSLRPGDISKGELVDFDAQMIVGWAPGAGATDTAGAPTPLPAGTAIKLAPGSRLVMQVHYSLDNFAARGLGGRTDQTRVELWFGKDAALRQAVWVPLLKYDFRVPAGVGPDDPRSTARAELALPLPLEVLGVAPHMHLRGKSIRVEALDTSEPDKGASCLLDVPRWDFHHQEGYWLERGVRVSRAALSCQWDNRREAQPATGGKRRPPRELRWGEGTDDEMCLAFLYATL